MLIRCAIKVRETMSRTQRNTTQRNATQSNATQRNATYYSWLVQKTSAAKCQREVAYCCPASVQSNVLRSREGYPREKCGLLLLIGCSGCSVSARPPLISPTRSKTFSRISISIERVRFLPSRGLLLS